MEIGFALLRNMVENVLLVQYAENPPKVPLEQTEIVKILAKEFVSRARLEFEGYPPGFPGYEQQFYLMLTDAVCRSAAIFRAAAGRGGYRYGSESACR